jgi:uncharacterized protein (DUF2235 family)
MPKNLVICCDGTANELAQDRTNVIKLYSVLEHDPAFQVTYYHPGLGTLEPMGALSPWRRRFMRMLGKAFGYGLEHDVGDVYTFLMHCYEPGDRVYLFGFSRGAYTVRAVASLLHACGLLRPDNEPLIPYALRVLNGIQRAKGAAAVHEAFRLVDEFKAVLSRGDCRPWFVGVWDTVSSVGWIENPLRLPHVSDNPDIEVGRHAISIDERRAFFRTNLWRPGTDPARAHGPKDLLQVWFPGVHSDVGGGYPEAESGLSKIALEWMLEEAEKFGLRVDPARKLEVLGRAPGSSYTAPDPTAVIHKSLKGLGWNLAEFVPKRHFDGKTHEEGRRMNLYRRRTIPSGSLIHHSAYQRGAEYAKRLPADGIQV